MNANDEPASQRKIGAILETLENLFVLEATKAGISQQEIRKILGISINRVNGIAKHVKVTNVTPGS